MNKTALVFISLALATILIVQISAQSCTQVGYLDRIQSDRSSRCPDTNRCCNDTDTMRIGELFMRQRERCWTTAFNDSRRDFNAFIEQFQNLIENIVQRSAIVSFGGITATPAFDDDYYDDAVTVNGDEIGDASRDYIRNNTSIDLVRTQFDDAVCSLVAGRVLVNRFRDLQSNYFICGKCLCNRILMDNPAMTVRDLVRSRLESAWSRYSRHLQRLRAIVIQIRNISSEGTPNRQIMDLCNNEAIRLLGCRRCAGVDQGTCDRVCISLTYFCREAYRRVILVHRTAPRIFLSIARALQDESTRESNEFSTGNTREAARMLESSVGGLEMSAYEAYQNVNRDRNISSRLCLFANNPDDLRTNDTDSSSPRQDCIPPNCIGCNDDCERSTCQGMDNRACTLPSCKGCPSRTSTECECINLIRKCKGRRRRDVDVYSRRAIETSLSGYIDSFFGMANAASMSGREVRFNTIFQSNCVCGSTLDRDREIALGRSSNCYSPFGEFIPNENIQGNRIFMNLSTSQQAQYVEGASVEALTDDLNTFEMQVTEGSNAGRISYSFATFLMALMLLLLLS